MSTARRVAGKRRSGREPNRRSVKERLEGLSRKTLVLLTAAVTLILSTIVEASIEHFYPRAVEVITGEDPLLIHARPNANHPGFDMALDRRISPSEAPKGSSCAEAESWVTELGGVPVQTSLAVHIQGQRSTPVEILEVRAHVLETRNPIDTTVISGCMPHGPNAAIGIGFDLDSAEPVAQRFDHELTGRLYFNENTISLTDGEAINFNIVGITRNTHVRWKLDVVALVDGKEEICPIGESDYETSARVATTEYEDRWSWGGLLGERPGELVRLE